MATIRKKAGKWQGLICRSFHKPISKTFISKQDAQRWARETERLIVEVFTIKDYFRAKFSGIKNPMFLFTDGRRNIIYSVLFNIKLISISTANVKKYENFLKYLFRNKVSIYSFSSNSLEFNQKYIGQSITGVYTDFWSIDYYKCTELNKKPNACIIY